jgi:serine/threonine-protein kinase
MEISSDNAFSRQRISPGTRLNGIYEVGALIATGGMGEIYKGQVIQTGDAVAIKLMLPVLAENQAALALFRKEASALHRLQHDAIVRYYVFTIEPVLQRPYLAMEYVDGLSLSEILERDGPLPFEAVLALMRRIAAGLQVAHECGIIHRDVSPDNIILPGGDVSRAKIIDFGIARSTQLSDGTVIGSGFAGKYNYVSPEQLGLFGGDVSARSDIYSLALVIVQALMGRPVDMGGSQLQIIEKRRVLPSLGAIDMRLRPLLERMLQPNPADRPTSMTMCVDALLGGSSDGKFNQANATRRPATDPQPQKKSLRGIYAAIAGALAVMVGAGYYYFSALDSWVPPPHEQPGLVGDSPLQERPGQVVGDPPPRQRPGQVAGDPSPRDPPTAPAEKIKRFLKQYNGGDCFFVMPVAVGEAHASLEGYGASTKPFEALDDAFKKDIGFAADIGVRLVTPPQCPAVNFVARLPNSSVRPPRIDIDKIHMTSQDTLNGSVDPFGNRTIHVLLVSPRGVISSVMLKDSLDAKTFTVKMQPPTEKSEPVLLMALAGAPGLRSKRFDRPAEEVFSEIFEETRGTIDALSVAVRYFRVER